MAGTDIATFDIPENPLDHVEALAESNAWPLSRISEDEAHMVIAAHDADLHLSLSWDPHTELLQLACMFAFRRPARRSPEIDRLLRMINARLALGHFDLWPKDALIVYRSSLPLSGGALAEPAQCEALIAHALKACEQYYPAFQFVLWAGKSAREAIDACLFETVGEA